MITEKLSLVIPTYKREKQIIKILGSLNNQITNDIFIEVNICDSFSNYDDKKFKIYKDNIHIKYYNIKKYTCHKKKLWNRQIII